MVVNTYIKTLSSLHAAKIVRYLKDLGYPNPFILVGSFAYSYYGININGDIDTHSTLPKDATEIYNLEDFLQNSLEWWW